MIFEFAGIVFRKKLIKLFLVFCLLLPACGRAEHDSRLRHRREERILFGTKVRVDICVSPQQELNAQEAFQSVWLQLQDTQRRLSYFDVTSDIGRVNNSDGQPVAVSAETYSLLRNAQMYNYLTKGAFDISLGALSELWRQAEQYGRLPAAAQVQQVQRSTGIDKIRMLKPNKVQLLDPLTRVDLGAIAAGHAADMAAKILREKNFDNFLLDLGGEIRAGGKSCRGQEWQVGIRDPRDPRRNIEILRLTDAAVATSGNYENYFIIQGQKWSHIISPFTGYPQKDVISASVIAPDAEWADVLATALCVLPPLDGVALVDSLGAGHAAMLVTADPDGKTQRVESKLFSSYKLKN